MISACWTARQRPRPAGAAARRAERPTRIIGTIRPDPGSSWSARRPPAVPGPSQLAGAGGRGRTSLRPGAFGPDGISRWVRASAERGRVQGPGRAEADLCPWILPVALLTLAIPSGPPSGSTAIFRPLWTSPDRSPDHPPDPSPDGSPNPSPDWVPPGVGDLREPASACLRWSDAPLRYVGVRLAD